MQKNKRWFAFWCILIIGVISLYPAEATIFDQKQNINYNLIFSADNATNCSFNYIQYSDNSISPYFNLLMAKNGQMFNLLIGASNFTKLGYTCMYYTCIDPSATPQYASGNTCINITPTGTSLTTGQGIVYIVLLLAGLFIFIITLYGALAIKWRPDRDTEGNIININKTRYFKPILYSFAYLELMWLFGILRSIAANFLAFDNASLFFEWLYDIMLYLLIPVTILTLFFTLVKFLQDKKLRRRIIRGIKTR